MIAMVDIPPDVIPKSLDAVILDTLRAAGDWLTRQQLATRIGRPARLQRHDIEVLERLVIAGKVEKQRRLVGIARTAFFYRAK